MVLQFYNTLTRKKEVFKPINDNYVKMYTCGPTVYDYAHIGNFRTFVFQDILRRYLKYKGYNVVQVMNLTDVDDKTIKGSKKEGIKLNKFTEKYAKAFFEDIKALNIEKAEFYPKATEHIDDMVKLIKVLLEKKVAYKGEDGSIYFSIKKFKDYGKLSKVDIKKLKVGARVRQDEYTKEQAQDFALWKAWTPEDGDVFWETELGKGRPGWHIECSVMSMKYLGETLDIHSGGVDLIFPHHENEIAQSEAATGKKFVNFWLHSEHLLVNGQKMAKSLGNFYTLRDLLEKNYDPLAIRYALFSTHYREQLNFTFKELEAAKRTVDKLNDFVDRISKLNVNSNYNSEVSKKVMETKQKFEEFMDDDLNMPQALSSIFDLISYVNKAIDERKVSKENLKEVYDLLLNFNKVLAIIEIKKDQIPKELLDLIFKRESARKQGNFKLADKIRDELKRKGILIEDTPTGPRWKRVR